MRYLALCCDYDGTIAHHGRVDEPTIAALERLRESGRRLVLVTGRELDQLQEVMPRLDLFARVVAENGALLSSARDSRGAPAREARRRRVSSTCSSSAASAPFPSGG
jgi:HAD superfamily hydrolase (TIGR01484 family)